MPHKDPKIRKEYRKKWYAEHKAERKAYNKEYGKTHKKEISENKKKYYKANKQYKNKKSNQHYYEHRKKRLKYQKEYEVKHRESKKVYYREYRKKHRDKRNTYNHHRRAIKMRVGGKHTTGEWETLKAQYNWTCPMCHKVEPAIKLSRDHIIPLVKGGSNNIENMQPLCGSCNSKKGREIKRYDYSPLRTK